MKWRKSAHTLPLPLFLPLSLPLPLCFCIICLVCVVRGANVFVVLSLNKLR
jgi:hypothetical protein